MKVSDRIIWTEILDLLLREIGSQLQKAKDTRDQELRVDALDHGLVLVQSAQRVSFELDQEAAN